jgi:fructose/tagatose bisphosphate aldolase
VDWLSVAVGSIHGAITGAGKDQAKLAARLHIEHLRLLRQITGVPLVLHGGSGVQKESVLDGIRNGIAKINIGTEIRQAYEKPLAAGKGEKAAQEAVAAKIEELIVEVYGIAGSRAKLCG